MPLVVLVFLCIGADVVLEDAAPEGEPAWSFSIERSPSRRYYVSNIARGKHNVSTYWKRWLLSVIAFKASACACIIWHIASIFLTISTPICALAYPDSSPRNCYMEGWGEPGSKSIQQCSYLLSFGSGRVGAVGRDRPLGGSASRAARPICALASNHCTALPMLRCKTTINREMHEAHTFPFSA